MSYQFRTWPLPPLEALDGAERLSRPARGDPRRRASRNRGRRGPRGGRGRCSSATSAARRPARLLRRAARRCRGRGRSSRARTMSSKYRHVSRAVRRKSSRSASESARVAGRRRPGSATTRGADSAPRGAITGAARRRADGPGGGDEDAGQDRGERARRHLEKERARAARKETGRPGGAGGGRLPLEEAAPGHGDAHEREDDRVHGFERVVREEGEADERLREAGLELLADASRRNEAIGCCGPRAAQEKARRRRAGARGRRARGGATRPAARAGPSGPRRRARRARAAEGSASGCRGSSTAR